VEIATTHPNADRWPVVVVVWNNRRRHGHLQQQ